MTNVTSIAKDETFSTSVNTDTKDHAIVRFAVSPSGTDKKNGIRFAIETDMDFTGVDRRKLIELAVDGLIIKRQRDFRKMYNGAKKAEALAVNSWSKMNVTEYLARTVERASADPVLSARTRLDNLRNTDPKAFDALMADFARSINAMPPAPPANGKKTPAKK